MGFENVGKKDWFLGLNPSSVSEPVNTPQQPARPDVGVPWTDWHFVGECWCVPILTFVGAKGIPSAEVIGKLKSSEGRLHSEGFLKGANWRRVGDRELRKTSRLVLVGSPCVHQSEAVVRELKVFRRIGCRVITVAFGNSLSKDRLNLVRLCRELSGVSLGERGQLEYKSKGLDEVFLIEAGKRGTWDRENGWKLARFLIAKPAERAQSPLTDSTLQTP